MIDIRRDGIENDEFYNSIINLKLKVYNKFIEILLNQHKVNYDLENCCDELKNLAIEYSNTINYKLCKKKLTIIKNKLKMFKDFE